jgi:hypothetical protein
MTISFDLFYLIIVRSIYVKSTKYITTHAKSINDYNTEENWDLILILHLQWLQNTGWIGATVDCFWGHTTLQKRFLQNILPSFKFLSAYTETQNLHSSNLQMSRFSTPNHRFSVCAPYVKRHIIMILYKNRYCCILSVFF